MKRPITLFSIQWGDLSLEQVCKTASEIGYEGIELSAAHINIDKAFSNPEYLESVKNTLLKYDLKCWAISNHLAGQCVLDSEEWAYDPRLDGFAPEDLAGNPKAIQNWAIDQMKKTAYVANSLGVNIVTVFMGSPIWKFWYSFPQTPETLVENAYNKAKKLWTPIMDVFDSCSVKLALEVHPSEIAFDYWSTKKLIEVFDNRPTLGINFDPSHLLWQGVDPAMFLYDFCDRIYHVHIKDIKMNLNGKNGILGSHLPFGDVRRAWNFVSPGHGDVDFEAIIRVLNQINYSGPLSVEWEDSGMDRVYGATEAYQYLRKYNFPGSEIAFDDAIKN